MLEKKPERITRGIKHWGLSGYSSFLPRIKFGVTGQESGPESPTISYRHRWRKWVAQSESTAVN